MTDGERSYESLFSSVFGEPYRALRARETEGASRRRATASKEASLTSNYSRFAKAGESWR